MNQQRIGKRGPRKGDGGRPTMSLLDSKDIFVICAALWLRFSRTGNPEPTAKEIRWLDLFFDGNSSVGFELENVGDHLFRVGTINPSGERAPSPDALWSRGSNIAAADGGTFWRSRVDLLRRKMNKKYWPLIDPKRKVKKSDKLTDDEIITAEWMLRSFSAIDVLLAKHQAAPEIAIRSLSALGWNELPLGTQQRLASIARRIAHATESKG